MFNHKLYVIVQEEKLLHYYFDKKTAMKALIRYILHHKSNVKILVFAPAASTIQTWNNTPFLAFKIASKFSLSLV